MHTGSHRHRQRRATIAALILPALLFRAAIPAGFMPMLDDDGRLGIMFCPGEVAVPQAGDLHAAHHHHHPEAGKPASTQHTLCPFALSASPAPLPIVSASIGDLPRPIYIAAPDTDRAFSPTIVRAQAARAPPSSTDC